MFKKILELKFCILIICMIIYEGNYKCKGNIIYKR